MGTLLHDGDQDLLVNWRTWRPTVAIIAPLNLFDDKQIKLMFCNLNVEITEAQATCIASHIESLLETDSGAIAKALTEEPGDGKLPLSDFKNWLSRFADFCRETNGFKVG